MLLALSVLVGLLLVFGLLLILLYNGLVQGRNMAEEAWSGISVQLKRRHDLIPSLVNTVKGFAAHESDLLQKLTSARSAAVAAPAGDVTAVLQAERKLTQAMHSLFAVSENYPQLTSSENFMQLQEQLAQLEDEIQMARRYYNGTARVQNNRVQQFPGNMVAGAFGFRTIDYFELDNPAEREVPEVKF